MTNYPTEAEARVALHGVDRARRRVIDQIGLPWWYWWGLAAAWVVLGILSDVADPWITLAATLVFGAAHSAVAQRLLAGTHRRPDVTVSRGVAGRRVALLMIGWLLFLVAVTVVVALLVDADGAQHPATIASVFVAVLILLGGPRLMDAIRAHAIRRAEAE
jgi:hypothetical protein